MIHSITIITTTPIITAVTIMVDSTHHTTMVDSTPHTIMDHIIHPTIADITPITAITVILWHMEGETGPAPFPQDGPAVHRQQQDRLQEGMPTIRPLRLQEHLSQVHQRRLLHQDVPLQLEIHPRAASERVMEEYHRILQSPELKVLLLNQEGLQQASLNIIV